MPILATTEGTELAPVILTLNAGSSSLKFALFRNDENILRGSVEKITESLRASIGASSLRQFDLPHFAVSSYGGVLETLLKWLTAHLAEDVIGVVGHRIVHGGPRSDPIRIDKAVLAELEALVPLAPLHQPHKLPTVCAIGRAQPALPQVGCFDTVFIAPCRPSRPAS